MFFIRIVIFFIYFAFFDFFVCENIKIWFYAKKNEK